ncbi:efflux RND transporter periplasmic adaptor subunit [Peribacillus frigoritolerans]|uniref:efflux RND transporter periplasmic adaptor subunit n=1 Tax=Peribacillus frigoritolerans TaxID=450367 RepID=UPI00105A39A0|nr:HlyD family efflux transporter periplasmic adaptor subunit [Peribacillus frigoritolerans]TDL82774.1 HlyD family efflux transporter periplasmic adaptor subunit [Peribacillus frigoritolerans]
MMSIKKKKKRTKIVIGTIIGLFVAGIAAAPFIMRGGQEVYKEVAVETGNLSSYYTFSGTVAAEKRETVRSKTALQIGEMKVETGDVVKKEDVLLETSNGEEIKAPIDGEISAVFAEENGQVMSGAELIEIVDYANLQMSMKVDEYDLKSVAVDKEVNVIISALDMEVKGVISSISKEAANENGVAFFTAITDLEEKEDIRVGMSAEAKILNERASDVPTLPMEAVQFDGNDNPYVLIPVKDGPPKIKSIKTGINDGDHVEITEGLNIGETVAIPSDGQASASGGFMPPRPEGMAPGGIQGGQ